MQSKIPEWIEQLYVNTLKHNWPIRKIFVDTKRQYCWVPLYAISRIREDRLRNNGKVSVQEFIDSKQDICNDK